ncbi:transcription termination factor Rho [Fibrobacter sp.]|uniref:transcription termination factor Rho n=1 Tax=Fibrobacter sp. TaxID=35828 RepID=UPI0025C43093|nr:transcription termination factor Rho [Fibrobacter sp.]MCI6436444.1 transcription termination factor Rho [Fibrobacter sp.]MDD7498858.1 transcription termination factor Rho [Fibrobacter sp.]MDY5725183.1 transcription termination factor Rho [Fibrobacter sp.]
MAPTKKNLKETHLADQESTGIDVPAEVQGNIELAPAEVAKPKRGRPSTKAAKTDGNDEKKPKKIKKIPEQEAVATGEEKIITDNAPVEPATTEIKKTNETVPSEANIQNAPAENQAGMPAENQGEGQNNGATENQGVAVDASQGEQGNSQQKFQNPQNRQFNKFNNKNNRRFDKNYRQNQRFQPEEEDTTPLPEPDSEAWNKARECWSKYRKMTMSDLQELAAQKENLDFRRYRKQSLGLLLQSLENENNIVYAEGLLEVTPQGHGFLRNTEFNYQQGPDDVYVSQNLIRKLGLKIGDTVAGLARPPRDQNDKYYALRRVDKVNFEDPEKIKRRVAFEYLTPIHPNEKIQLEWDSEELSTRVMDLFSPIGKGQRSIILAPPRTGKTILLQNMTRAIAKNHPEIIIIVLLIDERPEEVTEMREIIGKLVEANPNLRAEVVASTFDEPPDHHARVATMVLEKAKRLVEQQKDVVVLLDSITRFARANNVVIPHSGKILSGGVDANAMQFPKKFFGAARKIADKLGDFQKDSNGQVVHTITGEPIREIIQKNGSLTIIGTALIETGSRMDEVIFEEFKGTGNMELVLDRRLAEKRTWPAIDIFKSGTRKEDRLLSLYEQDIIWKFRQGAQNDTENGIMDKLIKMMMQNKTNAELLEFLKKAKDSLR